MRILNFSLYLCSGLMLCALPGCIQHINLSNKTTLSTMSYDQLVVAYEKVKDQNDRFTSLKYLERIVQVCTIPNKLRTHLLEYAHLLQEDGQLEKAGTVYQNFIQRYPTDERTQYAYEHAIECLFARTSVPTRDQNVTHQTLQLAASYLENPRYKDSSNRTQIIKITEQCKEKLMRAELAVIDCYLAQERYQSAQHRIELCKEEMKQQAPHLFPELLKQELRLAQGRNDTALATQVIAQLRAEFPTHAITNTVVAQADNKKPRSFIERF